MDKETKLKLLKWAVEEGRNFIEALESAHDQGELEHDYKECLCLVFERGIDSLKYEINLLTS